MGELPFYGSQEIAGKVMNCDIESFINSGRTQFRIWKNKSN